MTNAPIPPSAQQKLIYIAGPYRAADRLTVFRNISEAVEVASRVMNLGAAVIIPHTMLDPFDKSYPDSYFLQSTQTALLRCDKVLVVDTWDYQASEGTMDEIRLAEAHGIPVGYSSRIKGFQALQEWARE